MLIIEHKKEQMNT